MSKIEVTRAVPHSKSENMKSSGEKCLSIRKNASPKWDWTICPRISKRPLMASLYSVLYQNPLLPTKMSNVQSNKTKTP